MKVIWVSTVVRTGSMWLFNITREILNLRKFNVLPEKIPKFDEDHFEIFHQKSLQDQNHLNKYVFKVHQILKQEIPHSKILTTIRDPRDICVSCMKFMKKNFQQSLDISKNIITYYNTYEKYSKEKLKFIKYEKSIEKDTVKTIEDISEFIECKISFNEARKISEKFSKDNVTQLIKINDEKLKNKIKEKKEINRDTEIVYFSKDNYRAYDANTGFQTNHISSSSSQEWKKILTKEEIKILNSEFETFLIKNNYE